MAARNISRVDEVATIRAALPEAAGNRARAVSRSGEQSTDRRDPHGQIRLAVPVRSSSTVCRSTIHCGSCIPAARPGLPKADRARARRVDRVPQGTVVARRPRPRRPVHVVHDHRLDHVELRRVGIVGRVDDRAVRRRPGFPDLSPLWRLAATERVTSFGAGAGLLHELSQGGACSRRSRFGSVGAARDRFTGSPLPPDGLSLDRRRVRTRRDAIIDEWWNRRVLRVRSRCTNCRFGSAKCRVAVSAQRSKRSTSKAIRSSAIAAS